MTLEQIIEKLKKMNIDMNWDKGHTPDAIVKSIMIEASQLLENYQWKDSFNDENSRDEIADVMIYCLIYCYKMGYDPKEVILNKMEKNAQKSKNNSKTG